MAVCHFEKPPVVIVGNGRFHAPDRSDADGQLLVQLALQTSQYGLSGLDLTPWKFPLQGVAVALPSLADHELSIPTEDGDGDTGHREKI